MQSSLAFNRRTVIRLTREFRMLSYNAELGRVEAYRLFAAHALALSHSVRNKQPSGVRTQIDDVEWRAWWSRAEKALLPFSHDPQHSHKVCRRLAEWAYTQSSRERRKLCRHDRIEMPRF